jgi:hypothetical protein
MSDGWGSVRHHRSASYAGDVKRVAILGRGASGKSVLAARLGGILRVRSSSWTRFSGDQGSDRHREISGSQFNRSLSRKTRGFWMVISGRTMSLKFASLQRTQSSFSISRFPAARGGQSGGLGNGAISGVGSSRIADRADQRVCERSPAQAADVDVHVLRSPRADRRFVEHVCRQSSLGPR